MIPDIKAMAQALQPRLVELRREFHMHPEPAWQEHETARRVAAALREIGGMEVTEGLAGGTGVMAVLHGAKGPGKTILLRADMDALPIQEETGLPFQSRCPGVMHACGHDSHMTWLLGSAMLLSQLREQFPGAVKFVFQPAEEVAGGARPMVCDDHVLENPKVDAVFAAHAWPSIDAGKIGIAQRYAFGCPGFFSIKVTGKGGHGARPHECVDPIAISCQIYGALQQIISRKVDAAEPRVLSIGSIHAGPTDKGNIIPDTCTMHGTIRAVRQEVMEQMTQELRRLACGIAELNGAACEVTCHYSAAVENAPAMVELCRSAAVSILGEDNAQVIHTPNLVGEDFAEYTTRVPGAYFFVGIANDETRDKFGLHSPIFQLDESVLSNTAAVFAQLALNFLNS